MNSVRRMTYYCDSRSYLERAQSCLEREDPKYHFYAAFELRCFVESRQNEYLKAQKKYRDSLPSHWKIGKQSRELQKIFKQDKIQRITNTFPDGYSFVSTYVPVSKALKNNAERLGALLHAQTDSLHDDKISEQRNWLERILNCASECQTGNMLSPVFLDRSTGTAEGEVILTANPDELQMFEERLHKGALMIANVEYLDLGSDIT